MTFAFFGNVLMLPYSNYLSERLPWWMSGTNKWSTVCIPWFHSLQSQMISLPIMISHIHFRFIWQMRTPTLYLSDAFVSGWCQYHADQYIAKIRFSVWFIGKNGKTDAPRMNPLLLNRQHETRLVWPICERYLFQAADRQIHCSRFVDAILVFHSQR